MSGRNKMSMVRGVLAIASLAWTGSIHSATMAADAAASKATRVAIYADAGATKSDLPEVQRCLPESAGFAIKLLTAEQIRRGGLDDVEVLIHPGGSGSKQAATLGGKGREIVTHFVAHGGGFIGICAGAYLASAEYPWSLAVLDAHVVDDAHWARGQGNVQLHLSPTGQTALGTHQAFCAIHFENGPLLGPGHKDEIDDYEPLASFDTEIVQNGAPKGVMKGTAAIARGKFGKGRVVCFSPHPEKTPGCESFLQFAVRWAAHNPGERLSPRAEPQGGGAHLRPNIWYHETLAASSKNSGSRCTRPSRSIHASVLSPSASNSLPRYTRYS